MAKSERGPRGRFGLRNSASGITGGAVNSDLPRRHVARMAVMLLLATGGLVAFILGLGDFRRQQNALSQLRWHASHFERRIGAGDVMPLNFEPEIPPEGPRKMIPLQWLDRASASKLRGVDRPVVVAQTIPILQVFGRDGRAVMTFKGGKFAVEWLTLPRFKALWTEQQEVLNRLSVEEALKPPSGP